MALNVVLPTKWPTVASPRLLVNVLLFFLLLKVAQVLYTGIRVRVKFQQLKRQGMPVPAPHSIFLGHLPLILQVKRLFPRDAAQAYVVRELLLNWQLYFPTHPGPPSVIYLDLWPITPTPLVIASDPALNQLITGSDRSPPRHEQVKILSRAVGGPRQLFVFDDAEHRLWRSRLNPGFSARNLHSWVAHGRLIDELCIFAERMRKHAGHDGAWGEIFTFYPLAIDLTFDIICGLVLDFSPGEQINGPTELQNAFRVLAERHFRFKSLASLPSLLNPFWHLEYHRCHQKLRDILFPYIQRQLQAGPAERKESTRPKTVVDLALKEVLETEGAASPSKDFMEDVLGLTKQFIFAGHDTTAIVVSFAFHFLGRNPGALQKLRDEHDAVFGNDPRRAPELLRKSSHLLSSLPFTAAVVKESLRLSAFAGSVRQSVPGFRLCDPQTGREYPTDGFVIVSSVSSVHLHPGFWPRPTEFVPERWMVGEDDPLYPRTRYAWRPFEWGPLSCIGQELAVIEIKMALLFTVRDIDFQTALEDWDEMHGKKGRRSQQVYGDTVYQSSQSLLGPPVEDLPMRVRLSANT